MNLRLIRFVTGDVLRGRVVPVYAACLALAAFGLFSLGDDPAKALLGLLSLVLLVVPLVSAVFAAAHHCNAREFTELLAAQPLPRAAVLVAQVVGVNLALLGAVAAGILLPVLLHAPTATGLVLAGVAAILTIVFSGLAFLVAVLAREKSRAIGAALLLWLYFGLLHDGLTLYTLFLLEDFPVEGVSVTLLALNPVDLARVLVLLRMDVSALLGYSGAMLKDLLGTSWGMGCTAVVLAAWSVLPAAAAVRAFRRRDL